MGEFWSNIRHRTYMPDPFDFEGKNAKLVLQWAGLILLFLAISIVSQARADILNFIIMEGAALFLAILLVKRIAANFESKEQVATEFIKNYWNTKAYRRYQGREEA